MHYLCQVSHFSLREGGGEDIGSSKTRKGKKRKKIFPPLLALKVSEALCVLKMKKKNKTGKDGLHTKVIQKIKRHDVNDSKRGLLAGTIY